MTSLAFQLPAELEAAQPPEARGLARDQVRLMVSYRADNRIHHRRFADLPDLLAPGDVLVINTSATLKAALNATRASGAALVLHLSTHLPDGRWVVELRQPTGHSTEPLFDGQPGELIRLPLGASARLEAPYHPTASPGGPRRLRLWRVSLDLPCPLPAYLEAFGFPIRYSYVRQPWPIAYYQTVFATDMGSAEMPSAGRAFTPQVITALAARGVYIAPLLLHTGVASLEDHEPPYEEYYRVPAATAWLINAARAAGQRIIAAGTTVVRALETVAAPSGQVRGGEGWTGLVIAPPRRLYAVDGLLTGLHEPQASHLALLEALAGREHLHLAYAAALQEGYLWHEFGDLHLLLP